MHSLARDKNDAEACLSPTLRFLALKSEQQLAMQSVHRHRSRPVGNSTRLVNQARAFLLERGIAVPKNKRKFAERLPQILEDADNGLPDAVRELLGELPYRPGQSTRPVPHGAGPCPVRARALSCLAHSPGLGHDSLAVVLAVVFSKRPDIRALAQWDGNSPN